MSEAGADREPEAVHGVTVPAPHHHVNYRGVFFILVALTAVTVVAAFLPGIKQEWQKILIALTIASIKAIAVAYYFMHLKFEGKLIYLILFVPVSFCVMLVISLLPDISFGHIFHDFDVHAWRFGH